MTLRTGPTPNEIWRQLGNPGWGDNPETMRAAWPLLSILTIAMLRPVAAEAEPIRRRWPVAVESVRGPDVWSPAPSRTPTDLATDELLRRATRDKLRGRLGRAARHYHDALRLQSRNVEAMLGLAELRTRQGDTEEAQKILTKATRLPGGAKANDVLADLAASAGNWGSEFRHRQAALAKTPNARRMKTLADRLIARRAYPAALKLWRQLRQTRPQTAGLELQIAALSRLSSALDPVLAGGQTDNWVRRSIARISRRRLGP